MPKGYSNATGLPFFIKGSKPSIENIQAIKKANTGNKYCAGRIISESTRLKMSASAKKRGFTKEWREKMSQRHPQRGVSVPMERRIRIGAKQRGKLNHNWKGGITNKDRAERHLLEYKIWRDEVYKRDEFKCQICGQIGGKLQAHHILSFANFPEKRTDVSNGLTVCVPCHKYIHRSNHCLA